MPEPTSAEPRYRLDDLRRFLVELAESRGVAPVRAANLASQVLWFDAAGASRLGIAAFPELLRALDSKEIDPTAEGSVGPERNGTAVFDARDGIPLLALERAGAIATEKARDAGVGLVQVANLGQVASAAGVAAEIAIGPFAALIAGAPSRLSVAIPTGEGLPVLFDPALGEGKSAGKNARSAKSSATDAFLGAWLPLLVAEGTCLIAAFSIPALCALDAFQARISSTLTTLAEQDGRLLPSAWEERRRLARQHGVVVAEPVWKALSTWSKSAGIERPAAVVPG